jgi:predicted lipoprotein with Yx(FWY)xxD motif
MPSRLVSSVDMKAVVFLLCGLLALASCGDDEGGGGAPSGGGYGAAPAERDETATDGAATVTESEPAPPMKAGTTITLGDSEFGSMLFDTKRQAIYIFELDREGETNCHGECAEAWPPVFTEGKPKAGKGVDASLLGTVKRRDGRLQVTYAGKPLYFYAHEGPGEVKCHNVNLNGGLWWVIGPDGERRA